MSGHSKWANIKHKKARLTLCAAKSLLKSAVKSLLPFVWAVQILPVT